MIEDSTSLPEGEVGHPETATVVWLRHGRQRRLIDVHRRAIVGTARRCEFRVHEKGVARRHLKISAQPDGRLLVFPFDGGAYRINGVREHRPRTVEPGVTIGIGLLEIETGATPKSFIHDLRFAWEESQDSLREFRDRLPWLAISILVHLLLMWIFMRAAPELADGDGDGTIAIDLSGAGEASATSDSDSTEEREEYPEPDVPEPKFDLPDADKGIDEEKLASGELIDDPYADGFGGYTDKETLAALGTKLSKRKPKNAEDRRPAAGNSTKWTPPAPAGVSKRFVKTVASLRRSGLEIVFCFDSTGSMGPVLDAAKADLLELFELVEELVPRTRMGLITYRDRGDEYVTRATRLGVGRFEALAFLSSVTAGGGGDYPEAVDEALALASKFPWRPSARKITILVGDAPPHEKRMRRAVSTARRMSKRNGQVHVLVSGNHQHARPLQQIARAGGGRFLPRSQRDQLALQLLTFALGPDSDQDIEKLLQYRRQRSNRRSPVGGGEPQDALPDVRILAGTLARPDPDPVIVEAWTWARGKALRELPAALAERALSREGTLALYYVVNRALERHGRPERISPPKLSLRMRGMPDELRRPLQRLRS